MRTAATLGLSAALFVALLGAPSSTAAQCETWEQALWGQDANEMSSAMQSAWITNLGQAVPSSTNDVCHGILSAAHEGAQRASAQCGIFWVPRHRLRNEWGFGNGTEGMSVIALAKEYQSPSSLPRDAPKLGEIMVHEGDYKSVLTQGGNHVNFNVR
jgi:hypothetical protein